MNRPAKTTDEMRNYALQPARQFDEFRCDLRNIGREYRQDPAEYAFDNTQRGLGGYLIPKKEVELVGYLLQVGVMGEGRFEDLSSGTVWQMTPGRAFLTALPSPTRYWLPEGHTWTFYYCFIFGVISAYHCGEIVRKFGHVLDLPLTSGPVPLLQKLYERVSNNNTPDDLELSTMAYQLLMGLRRHAGSREQTVPESLAHVRAFVEQYYDDPFLDVTEMAKEAGLSRAHFSRRFRAIFGTTPAAYLTQIRLHKAMDLLVGSDIPLKEVAHAVGFSDYPYFCNSFRRHMHATPGDIRAQRDHLRITDLGI